MEDCGITIAHHLAKSGLGRELFAAASQLKLLDSDTFQLFLQDWRQRLRHELSTDAHHALGRRYKQLAKSISDSFPPLPVLANYVHPVTSQSDGDACQDAATRWVPRLPAIATLARLCEHYFSWKTIQDKFSAHVWQGACVRRLVQVCDVSV